MSRSEIIVMSRCHEYEGGWKPEPESINGMIGIMELRPGATEEGTGSLDCGVMYHWKGVHEKVPDDHRNMRTTLFHEMVKAKPLACCHICKSRFAEFKGRKSR